MRQLALIVEGQSEEVFANGLLLPAAAARGFHLTVSIVKTSHSGGRVRRGGGDWSKYETQIRSFLKARNFHRVGLLMDFYGYPSNAPGVHQTDGSSLSRRDACLRLMSDAFHGSAQFIPHLMLHEFEALVLAALEAGAGRGHLEAGSIAELAKVVHQAGGAENVNDGPVTSPSKRIMALDREYMKTVTGNAILDEAGLPALLERCPDFAAWWEVFTAP